MRRLRAKREQLEWNGLLFFLTWTEIAGFLFFTDKIAKPVSHRTTVSEL